MRIPFQCERGLRCFAGNGFRRTSSETVAGRRRHLAVAGWHGRPHGATASRRMLSALYGTCPGPVRHEKCHSETAANQADRQPFRSACREARIAKPTAPPRTGERYRRAVASRSDSPRRVASRTAPLIDRSSRAALRSWSRATRSGNSSAMLSRIARRRVSSAGVGSGLRLSPLGVVIGSPMWVQTYRLESAIRAVPAGRCSGTPSDPRALLWRDRRAVLRECLPRACDPSLRPKRPSRPDPQPHTRALP